MFPGTNLLCLSLQRPKDLLRRSFPPPLGSGSDVVEEHDVLHLVTLLRHSPLAASTNPTTSLKQYLN